jgi:hypothetical protein
MFEFKIQKSFDQILESFEFPMNFESFEQFEFDAN